MPHNTIKYARGTYNIKNGPGNGYSTITTVAKNDELEILNSGSSFTKIRTPSGTVGYIASSGYSSSKSYYIQNVPYLNQFSLGYPTGCEAVSATMAARYSGYNVSAGTIISNTPTDERGIWSEIVVTENKIEIPNEDVNSVSNEILYDTIIKQNEVWYGGNPFNVFVGHPTKGLAAGSYGCFASPIVAALQASGVPCTNISGCSSSTLFSYIEQGKPVIVWCIKNAGNITEGTIWQYTDGSGSFTKLIGEHCAVLIGYDGEYVYLNDPSAGKGVKQSKGKFLSNWNTLYGQAIVIN